MKNQQPGCQISKPPSRQFVITLNVPESAIIRIEALDRSGQRHDVPDSELALLAGDYVVEDLQPVGGLACLPELHDESGDFELDDCEDGFDEDMEPVAVQGGEGHRLIPREARTFLLGHLLRQRFLRRQCWDQFPPHWEIVFSVRTLLH
jgi:hypothetical protein